VANLPIIYGIEDDCGSRGAILERGDVQKKKWKAKRRTHSCENARKCAKAHGGKEEVVSQELELILVTDLNVLIF
jgi:hypothetical protein